VSEGNVAVRIWLSVKQVRELEPIWPPVIRKRPLDGYWRREVYSPLGGTTTVIYVAI